jgi:hypothetical protein
MSLEELQATLSVIYKKNNLQKKAKPRPLRGIILFEVKARDDLIDLAQGAQGAQGAQVALPAQES